MGLGELLKKGDYKALVDRKIFEEWAEKKISTSKAIELFRKNNKVKNDIYITQHEFKKWLQGLGYRRVD